jgi:hypothetical protein
MRKLRTNKTQVMLPAIQFGIFCLLVCCLKNVKIKIHKTIILPVVLYGFETWSLTLKEEHRLRVLENRFDENIWTEEG